MGRAVWGDWDGHRVAAHYVADQLLQAVCASGTNLRGRGIAIAPFLPAHKALQNQGPVKAETLGACGGFQTFFSWLKPKKRSLFIRGPDN
jgi:hypothetical protein